jgi:hypothetical protein
MIFDRKIRRERDLDEEIQAHLLGLAGGMLGVILATWSVREIATMPAFDLPRVGDSARWPGPRIRASALDFKQRLVRARARVWSIAAGPGFRAENERGSGRRRKFARLSHIDIGFNPAGLLAMRISLPPARYGTVTKTAAFHETLVRQVESVPGVNSAAVTFYAPMTGRAAGVPVQDARQPRLKLNERPIEIIQIVSPDYFRTLGIPLRRGREFTARDKLDAPPVAIIDENLARVLWPGYPNGTDPVGQRILLGASPEPQQIVGIVAPVRF